MYLDNVKRFCLELKQKGNYSIDPKDIRLSQRITTLLMPEMIELLEHISEMDNWHPSQCIKFTTNSNVLCICDYCVMRSKINRILK